MNTHPMEYAGTQRIDPSDEMVDIIDHEDHVLGQAPRSMVHAQGWLHRFVQGMVLGSDGRWLLQQRSLSKAKGPGLWDASVGEHVHAAENYAAAIVRGATEELNLSTTVQWYDLGKIYDKSPGIENMLGRLYIGRSDGPFEGWEQEAERLEWMDEQALTALAQETPDRCTGGLLSSIALLQTDHSQAIIKRLRALPPS